MTTGSQGEPMSGLARMSVRDHKQFRIVPGDTVVISATPIPGNEKSVHKTINNLCKLGATVIHGTDGRSHVSGHASQEELLLMLNLVRPEFFVPVHGEYRMLAAHGRLAVRDRRRRRRTSSSVENGDVLEFTNEYGDKVGKTYGGHVFVDGSGIGDVGEAVLRDRKALSNDGIMMVVVAIDSEEARVIAGPDLISKGVFYSPKPAACSTNCAAKLDAAIEGISRRRDARRRYGQRTYPQRSGQGGLRPHQTPPGRHPRRDGSLVSGFDGASAPRPGTLVLRSRGSMALWPRTRLCYTGGMAAVRKLADNQLQTFSHRDYIPDSLFDGIVQMVGENFKDGDFSFLDAGGGPGLFTDRLLERFPKSRGAVLDNSELLLSENTSNERKLLVLASATDMSAELVDRRFDIIFFNLSLHHFIGKTYSETRRNQRNALAQAVSLLAPGGRVVVTENCTTAS